MTRAVRRVAGWFALLALAACEEGGGTVVPEGFVQREADMPNTNNFSPPVEEPLAISSTFGPRWKYSDDRYDFHRGIDYYGALGDPILSIGDGVVSALYAEGSPQYPNGGNVLIVRYDLEEPFVWKDTTIDRLYAVYLHLESFAVGPGDQVSEGQTIAAMGDSGDTAFVHLHFETRVQTTCSLEYQVANPGQTCAQYGFDPHVHPYVFVGGKNENVGLGFESDDGAALVVTYQATRGDLDLNVLDTDLGTLNFNRRAGIDATSTAALDDFDYGWVTVVPDVFVSESEAIRCRFEFPERPAYVELLDIYGFGVRFDTAQ